MTAAARDPAEGGDALVALIERHRALEARYVDELERVERTARAMMSAEEKSHRRRRDELYAVADDYVAGLPAEVQEKLAAVDRLYEPVEALNAAQSEIFEQIMQARPSTLAGAIAALTEWGARDEVRDQALAFLREFAAGQPASGNAPLPLAQRPDESRPKSLLQLVERWHQLGDRFDRSPMVPGSARWLADRRGIERTIADTPARGDADLIAKAGALRRLVEQDAEPEDRVGRLALSLLDDFDRLIGGGS